MVTTLTAASAFRSNRVASGFRQKTAPELPSDFVGAPPAAPAPMRAPRGPGVNCADRSIPADMNTDRGYRL